MKGEPLGVLPFRPAVGVAAHQGDGATAGCLEEVVVGEDQRVLAVGLEDAALDQPLTPLLAALRQGWRGGETAHGACEHNETLWGVITAAVDTGASAAAEEQFSLLCGGGGGGEGIKERETEAGDEGVPRLEDLQAFRCQGSRGVGLAAAVAVLLHEALRQADLLEGMPFIFF